MCWVTKPPDSQWIFFGDRISTWKQIISTYTKDFLLGKKKKVPNSPDFEEKIKFKAPDFYEKFKKVAKNMEEFCFV